MPPPGRDPNYTYFDSDRRPEPGSEYQNNMNRYPMGPYDPNGQQFPDWVDPTGGYKIEYNVDGQPYYAWYPNGEYQGGNPFIDGDAFMERSMYPRYTADRLPDPNWRPSYPGERPPWMNAPEPDNARPQTPEELQATYARQDARNARRKATGDTQREAYNAGARVYKTKNGHQYVYYPPGYKGPRLQREAGNGQKYDLDTINTPGREGLVEDDSMWSKESGWTGGRPGSQPSQAGPQPGSPGAPSSIPPGPEPEVVQPGSQMSWEELEASRRAEWEAGGRKGTEYFDRYGNYHSDGFSSGPKQTPEEQQYYAKLRQTDPRIAKAYMFDAGDWQGQDMLNNMRAVKGPNGSQRMVWNSDRQSQIEQSFTPEQRAAAEAKMNAYNQQFDPHNIAGNPAYAKEAEFQQMARFHNNFDPNGTPYQRAQYAKWQQMLAERQGGGQQRPAPAPMPGSMPTPRNLTAPQQQQPTPQQPQNRQFANDNPFLNAKGELRNRAVKKLGHMVSRVQQGPNFNPFA